MFNSGLQIPEKDLRLGFKVTILPNLLASKFTLLFLLIYSFKTTSCNENTEFYVISFFYFFWYVVLLVLRKYWILWGL